MNWKAATLEDKKKMWGVFKETGIFTSACQHGIILWITNMISSGKLYVSFFFILYVKPYVSC